jgi:hypothetical protein
VIHPDCTMPNCECVGICQHAGQAVPVNPVLAALWHGRSCPYCDEKMDIAVAGREPTWDHIVPRSRGGNNSATNRLSACRSCNVDKADFMLHEWAMRLSKQADPRAIYVHRVLNLTRHLLVSPKTERASNHATAADRGFRNGAPDS